MFSLCPPNRCLAHKPCGDASYGDEQEDGTRAGFDNVFTQRNTTFMAFNLLHAARMLKSNGGYPAIGNVRTDWDAGCKPGWPNPEHR